MASFRVDDTFTLKGRHRMCAVGAVLDGQVRVGMTARLEGGGECGFEKLIHAVEFANRAGGAVPVLVFRYSTDAAAVESANKLAPGSILLCIETPA